jgi:hypothetical protein
MSFVATPANQRFPWYVRVIPSSATGMNRMSSKFNAALGVAPQGFCRVGHEEQ